MTVVCAWCQKHLGEKYPEQPGVTHGICESCAKKVKEEAMNKKRQTDEHCACGHRLHTAIELDTGLCLTCLAREDLYEGHEHADPEKAASKVDAVYDELRDGWARFEWRKGASRG